MAESSENQGKRKKKSKKYYGGGKKGKYEKSIKVGMRGVLVFGADNEAKARREAYNLLNEYADELFGTEFMEHVDAVGRSTGKKIVINYQHGDGENIVEYADSESSEEEEEDDIENAIAKEIEQIKSLKKSRRFQYIPTGVNAILFIRTTLSKTDLNRLVHCILSDIAKTKQNKVRSFQRLVPITDICLADLKSINKTVIEEYLPGEDCKDRFKICVHFKSRFNSSLKRNDVLQEIASIFTNVGHEVDLTSPNKVIVVELMKSLCFMNMLNDFFHFKRYNLHSIANEAKDGEKNTAGNNPTEGNSVKAQNSVKKD